MAVALTRVTVGNTECPFKKLTPSERSLCRFGVSSGLMESGRSPSKTKTRLRRAFPGSDWAAADITKLESQTARTIRKFFVIVIGYLLMVFKGWYRGDTQVSLQREHENRGSNI